MKARLPINIVSKQDIIEILDLMEKINPNEPGEIYANLDGAEGSTCTVAADSNSGIASMFFAMGMGFKQHKDSSALNIAIKALLVGYDQYENYVNAPD